ncbi:hypothetical protein EYF80_066191 [Liparis tanakae]|uniref:Uncharacterized protein n=1 Tax=Liparis tanakae TaxID=230148 RepID=A0A4Z2E4L6_9TELE|nr:hypothetical protein EYF80_066191 [Liparis tanakae]
MCVRSSSQGRGSSERSSGPTTGLRSGSRAARRPLASSLVDAKKRRRRHLPQQPAAVGFQRSLPGGRTDAGGHLEVQSPQRLHVCGGHPAQGEPSSARGTPRGQTHTPQVSRSSAVCSGAPAGRVHSLQHIRARCSLSAVQIV